MNIVAVIPARYNSSRFLGKPLAKILDKPMIWWVYNQVIKVKGFSKVIVATDHKLIHEECNKYNIPVIMTSPEHITPTDRIFEVSNKIDADLYVCINGDEPLVEAHVIEAIIPKGNIEDFYVANIITKIKNSAEVIDSTNLKVVTNDFGIGIYISRSPIPYPKGSLECTYKKHVGVVAFTKTALDFYSETVRGTLEKIEDIDLLRFIENGKKVHFFEVDCNTLSVDTPKDLDKVITILKGI